MIQIEEKFKQLGLSENEIAVYLFLTKKQISNIQQISNSTSIPRSTIYETLKTLLIKGLIEEIVQDKKKEYRAYPLQILKHNFREEQNKLEENIRHLDILENTIGKLDNTNQNINNFEIRKYSGKAGARQLFWNTLNATDTVLVYSFFGRSKYVGKEFYESFVRESKSRQIKEKVIINPSERVLDMIKKDNNTSKARTNPNDIRLIDLEKINIQGETFIYNNIFATVYLDREKIVGFEIESKNFVDTQRSMFDVNWKMAKELVI